MQSESNLNTFVSVLIIVSVITTILAIGFSTDSDGEFFLEEKELRNRQIAVYYNILKQ